jgi:hypothetical protein
MLNYALLCSQLCAKELRTAQMMSDGVAFYNPPEAGMKAYYVVFSHEGELIDYLSVFDVESMVKKVKEFGGAIGKCRGVDNHPGFTLAWEGMA